MEKMALCSAALRTGIPVSMEIASIIKFEVTEELSQSLCHALGVLASEFVVHCFVCHR